MPTTITTQRATTKLNNSRPKKTKPLCILTACIAAFFCETILSAQDFPHEQIELEKHTARFFDGEKIRELQIFKTVENNSQDEICIAQFFSQTRYYNLHFSDDTIFALKSAAALYNSDFENRKLSRKNKKSITKYGKFSAQIEWGTSRKNMTQISREASAAFGYVFVKKSPYFSISVQSAQAEKQTSKALANSGNVTLFFTKAQLAQFIAQMQIESAEN